MQYAFCIGIQITTRQAYSSLSEAQRSRARNALRALVPAVDQRMGTFDTETPYAFINERLEAIPSAEWSVSAPLEGPYDYRWDERLGCWVCGETYALQDAGAAYEDSVIIDQVEVGANFLIYQSAEN